MSILLDELTLEWLFCAPCGISFRGVHAALVNALKCARDEIEMLPPKQLAMRQVALQGIRAALELAEGEKQ